MSKLRGKKKNPLETVPGERGRKSVVAGEGNPERVVGELDLEMEIL